MNSQPNFTNNSWNGFNWLLAALALCLTGPARAGTQPSGAIPFSEIGARVTADYQGDALGVTATAEGARLRCGFQKLEGHATPEGLWLESTKPGGGKLRLVATALGRAGLSTLNSQPSTILPATGTVSVQDKLIRFTRPGLTEEYSVSVDGVRQDFIIAVPPEGAGDLRVELALSGARAEAAAYGAGLMLEGSGRVLAYSRLRVTDATGREVTARLAGLSASRLAVQVADANATYPIRIDPTFSDADWVSLNPAGIPGANGSINAVVDDGSGNLYVGGQFDFVGKVPANCVAKWDGSAWSALGSGIISYPSASAHVHVDALAVIGTDVYAGGRFTAAGGVWATNIAKWNGKAWSALGSGMNDTVAALAASGANLYVGGAFTVAGGVVANRIARWDGSAWSALGSGMNNKVNVLMVNGVNLYAGGNFTTGGGVSVNRIAKWDGSTWSSLGSGMNNGVYALAVSGTNLYAGGQFTSAGGLPANSIAKWDGSAWSALSLRPGADYVAVHALAASSSSLYVTGDFEVAPNEFGCSVDKWDGSAWSALGGMESSAMALAVSGTNLYVGGDFTTISGVTANCIAKWDGSAWSALGCSGMNREASALAVIGTNLYVGGYFTTAGGVTANGVAKWNGSAWSALGSGMNSTVWALAAIGTNLYAGGYFTTAGGVPANNIAKWDGIVWSGLGLGMSGGGITALAVSGTNLYAGGWFTTAGGVSATNIAKWNGSAWSALGSGLNNSVYALAVSGTNLYAGGIFTGAGGVSATNIARWNGSAWSALAGGMNSTVWALAVSGTNLYAGGQFDTAGRITVNGIAEWNGSTWSALGSGMSWSVDGVPRSGVVSALLVIGTNLYAGGPFTNAGGVPANYIAKWDGHAWSALGSGLNNVVEALAADEAGHLFVGGVFSLAGTNVSPYIAQANLSSAPSVLTSLQTQTAEADATVILTVDAAGEPPPAYQWYFNGTNLLSCSSSDLVLTNIPFSQSGTYTVVITNVFGAVTSGPVMLNVIPAVQRRPVPGVQVTGQAGSVLNLDYAEVLRPAPNWTTLGSVSLISTSQYYFDLTLPLPPQRYYRAWRTGTPGAVPPLDLHLVSAITLTGSIGGSVRVHAINQFGPIDAWFTLHTVVLTNTSQLYFDTSAWRQPQRLYRLVPLP